MPGHARRRLPARVYWVRRIAVLGTVLALAFAVGRLFVVHGDDASAASSTSAAASPTVSVAPPMATGSAASPTGTPTGTPAATPSVAATPTLVPATSTPTGPCSDDEVTVTPAVTAVAGGGDVVLPMNLTTTTDNACTWKVSSSSLVVAISKGDTRIWSSQDCPQAVPVQDVVVRPSGEQPTQVLVPWGGRRSVAGCTTGQAWVDPGAYTITAASLGGAPAHATFRVVAPPQPTVTKTIKPKVKKNKTPTATPTG